MSGFRAPVQSNVELQVQQVARLDFTLQVGEIAQAIEITGKEVHRPLRSASHIATLLSLA